MPTLRRLRSGVLGFRFYRPPDCVSEHCSLHRRVFLPIPVAGTLAIAGFWHGHVSRPTNGENGFWGPRPRLSLRCALPNGALPALGCVSVREQLERVSARGNERVRVPTLCCPSTAQPRQHLGFPGAPGPATLASRIATCVMRQNCSRPRRADGVPLISVLGEACQIKWPRTNAISQSAHRPRQPADAVHAPELLVLPSALV